MNQTKNLWEEYLRCESKNYCCGCDISFPLFLTEKEREIKEINTHNPCVFFNKVGLCDIHNERPFDCRFFPFDILKIDGKFVWIFWKLKCPPIQDKNKEDFEPYLKEHEENLIPYFKNYLDDYSKFRLEEFLKNYQYEILREVNLGERLPSDK